VAGARHAARRDRTARDFLGLGPTEDPLRWRLPVVSGVATGGRFLFCGRGLAAGIEATDAATGRPCVWATAQYLSFAPLGSLLELQVILAVSGHQVTQARVLGSVDGQEILTVNAALGTRPLEARGMCAQAPDVPACGRWARCGRCAR